MQIVGVGLAVLRARGRLVVVKAEEPLDEEHDQKAGEHPHRNGSRRPVIHSGRVRRQRPRVLHPRVRQQVQQRHAEHDAGDEADQDLHPPVGERDQ